MGVVNEIIAGKRRPGKRILKDSGNIEEMQKPTTLLLCPCISRKRGQAGKFIGGTVKQWGVSLQRIEQIPIFTTKKMSNMLKQKMNKKMKKCSDSGVSYDIHQNRGLRKKEQVLLNDEITIIV